MIVNIISKELISKSFDDAIYKCSQGYTLNKQVIATFDKFHDETCGKKPRKTEKAIFADEKGNIVYQKNGGEHKVNPDWKKVNEAYIENGELHITHNHPRRLVEECLSTSDIHNIYKEVYVEGEGWKYPIKSISCESPNGSRMTLVRGDNFSGKDVTDVNMLAERLEEYSNAYESKFYDTVFKLKEEHPYESVVDEDAMTSIQRYDSYVGFITDSALKEIGAFEKGDEFKEIQKGFSDANCKLTYTFPREFNFKIDVV